MVNIRRPAQRNRRGAFSSHFGSNNASGSGGNSGGMCSKLFRWLLFGFIAFQLISMTKHKLLSTTSNSSSIPTTQSNAIGLQHVLENSKRKGLRNGNVENTGSNNYNNNDGAVKLPVDHQQLDLHEPDDQGHPHGEHMDIHQNTPAPEEQQQDTHTNSHDQHEQQQKQQHHDPEEHIEPDLPHPDEYHDEHDQKHPRSYSGSNESFKVVLEKQGSGPTKVGYVKHFAYEREHPIFRTEASNHLVEDTEDSDPTMSIQHHMEQTVAELVKEPSVKACRHLNVGALAATTSITKPSGSMNPKCLDADTMLIVYNEANFPRTWCGNTIQPKTAIRLTEHHCTYQTDPYSTIFTNYPYLIPTSDHPQEGGRGESPVIIKSHSEDMDPNDQHLEDVSECSVSCKVEKGMVAPTRHIQVAGIPNEWSITQTYQDSYFHPAAKVERLKHRNDIYFSTQNFKSSVPLTYFDPIKYSSEHVQPAIDFNAANPRGVYMINESCNSQGSKRGKYIGAATKLGVKIDAMGECHHNTDVPEGESIKTPEGRINIMKKYRMVMAFDAVQEADHISTMVWEALLSGSLPVVVSAKNIEQHVPPNSIISSNKFKDWDELAVYIKKVMDDQALWESYHEWRKDIPTAWQTYVMDKYEFSKASPECRLCKWGYAKAYGLGWNPSKQEIVESKISSSLCMTKDDSNDGLVSKPFQEEWLVRRPSPDGDSGFTNIVMESAVEGGSSSCSNNVEPNTMHTTTIEHESYKVHRTVVQHDGVTDIIITGVEGADSSNDDIVLRLHFSPTIRNIDGSYFPHPHVLVDGLIQKPLVSSASMQDSDSRVTIIADWITDISSPAEGVMDVTIAKTADEQQQLRIRVIPEDAGLLLDKMTEFYPSSFSKVMTKDFVDPLELFHVES